LQTGDKVILTEISGMPQLNGKIRNIIITNRLYSSLVLLVLCLILSSLLYSPSPSSSMSHVSPLLSYVPYLAFSLSTSTLLFSASFYSSMFPKSSSFFCHSFYFSPVPHFPPLNLSITLRQRILRYCERCFFFRDTSRHLAV
jgi:hypothetical protein